MGHCEVCEKPDEVLWRLQEVERKADKLMTLLVTAVVSSISTLVGVIVILFTK